MLAVPLGNTYFYKFINFYYFKKIVSHSKTFIQRKPKFFENSLHFLHNFRRTIFIRMSPPSTYGCIFLPWPYASPPGINLWKTNSSLTPTPFKHWNYPYIIFLGIGREQREIIWGRTGERHISICLETKTLGEVEEEPKRRNGVCGGLGLPTGGYEIWTP